MRRTAIGVRGNADEASDFGRNDHGSVLDRISEMNRIFLDLELATARSAGEGDDIADVFHAGNKHEHALEA
jgi:hypothetical protein